MNKLLYKAIQESDKTLIDISQRLQCSVDELVDKICGCKSFTTDEIGVLINYIPLTSPVAIFFNC